ncbi:MAG: hybrid sensor histidine kinase/response regulator [Rhizobium sp.]|nr:MAG: hybrid sensor histidine kinase/response regulator [Rhizobium sp.]
MNPALPLPAANSASSEDALNALVLREQVASLFATIRTATYGDSVVAMVFGLIMYSQTHHLVTLAWMAVHFYTVLRLPMVTAYFKDPDADRNIQDWIRIYCRELRVNSTVWGLAPLLFLPESLPLTTVMMLVIMGLCTAGVLAVSPLLRAVYNYILPMMLGLTLALALRADILNLFLAGCCAVFLLVVLRFAQAQHRLLAEALRTRFEKAALAERLEEQMRATELASQEKTRFLAAASHDLRQPLHAIALLGAALENELAGKQEQGNASRLMRAVNTLSHSLDIMLDVSRLDAGVVVADRQPVALRGLFQSINQSFVNAASQKDIQLRLRSSPLWVDSDPQLLRRMLSNLIDNAIKYTRKGGVLVVARQRHSKTAPRQKAEIWIDVYDSGIGIAVEQQPRVFEEFYQVGNPGRDRSLGLGIGLSIVKRLSQLLDHPVELRSVPKRGTRFRLKLPAAQPQKLADPAPPLIPQQPSAQLPKRVLVLDDEADVREAMSQLLQSHGIQVDVAATETEAAEALTRSVKELNPFDLLICDFRLADGVDGLEAGQMLSRQFLDIPVLLITGETAPERLQRVRETGVPVLFKPVNSERLLQAMASALG